MLPLRLNRRSGAPLLGTTVFGAALVALAGVTVAQEVRWATPVAPPAIPASPEDPTQAKVYAVFDRLCAQCHQTGKLAVPAAGHDLGHILDIQRLGADPTLVRPGNPDASRLYALMQMRSAPHDADAAGKDLEVAAADLDAVRDWIASVKPAPGCADRAPLTVADTEKAIEAAGNSAPLTTRYLSLRHLYNACATPADLKAYRHAATVVVNSLSWGLKPTQLATIDPEETLLKVDLTAIGWDASRWQRLVEVYPYRPVDGRSSTASSPSTLRADWFVANAMRPPLYYELLGLPDRLQTLQASLRIDAANEVAQNRVKRIGLKTTMVARGSRLLQRHAFANGAFWTTYEYAPTAGRQDLFDAPAGPGTRGAPKPDASLSIFNLPSGYTAFFMANGDGLRLNDIPQSVVRHEGFPSLRISAGSGCMACHSRGYLPATDELRARVQGDTSIPRDIRDKVMALHAPNDDMKRLIEDDNVRLAGAMAQAGLIPGATLNGDDPVVALMRRYERDVLVDDLASEVGVPIATLRNATGKTTGPAGDLLERIIHGPVTRRTVERGFAALQDALAGLPVPDGNAVLPAETDRPDGLQLIVKSGPQTFRAGDTLTLKVRTSESCYLTLINVDRNGRGSVVYPNDFEQNNFLEAGKELKVPADGAPYVFRLRDPGRELVIGHCMTASKVPPGIRHDFERQRFTELGDYRAFLNRTAGNEGAKTSAGSEPKARRRNRSAQQPLSNAPVKGEAQGRAAVQLEITP